MSIPSGNTVKTSDVVRGVELTLSGRKMEAELYALGMKDFDVILGMDWLSKNRVVIRCYDREIDFIGPDGDKFTFYGAKTNVKLKVVSAMKAIKMLRK